MTETATRVNRAVDSLHALLHATPDRAWPHVETMALETVEAELRRLHHMEHRMQAILALAEHEVAKESLAAKIVRMLTIPV